MFSNAKTRSFYENCFCVALLLFVLASSVEAVNANLYRNRNPGTSTCARKWAGSGDWVLQNEYRDMFITVVLDHDYTEGPNSTHDTVSQRLSPRQTTFLGCTIWFSPAGVAGHQEFNIRSVTLN